MFFVDALTLDAPRRVSGGYLAVRAKAARTGVYDYAGREVDPDNAHGLRDQAIVKVLRDEATVFDTAAVRTFIGKPITDDHPKEAVTRDNWRDHGRGVIMGALRDGDHLAFDLLLMDGPTIDKVEAGKRQLSNGYAAELEFGDFKAPDGTACQARQSRITDGNHVALVDRARGGESCRIADAAPCSAAPKAFLDSLTVQEKPTMKITIGDAKDVDLSDGAAVALAVGPLNTSLADTQKQVGTLTADLATANTALDAEKGKVAALEAKLEDAKVTPEKLQQLADARADVIGKAKTLAPALVTDGKTDADIRKESVQAKLGDAAKGMSDAAIEGAFLALTKDAKVDGAKPGLGGMPVVIGDAVSNEAKAWNDSTDFNSWRTAGSAKA